MTPQITRTPKTTKVTITRNLVIDGDAVVNTAEFTRQPDGSFVVQITDNGTIFYHEVKTPEAAQDVLRRLVGMLYEEVL